MTFASSFITPTAGDGTMGRSTPPLLACSSAFLLPTAPVHATLSFWSQL
jgi:hypothetical protein